MEPNFIFSPEDQNLTQSPSPTPIPAGRTLHLDQYRQKGPELPVAGYSCSLSSVDHGGKLVYDFDPDPSRVVWGMNAQINLLPTRGGQVAYSSGRTIGPLQIVGYLRNRWDLLDLGEFVYKHMKEAQIDGKPLRFRYPERDFDFSVYIQSLDEVGLDSEQGELVAYTLICVVTQDHTELKEAEVSKILPGLPENIEWIDVENAAKIAEQRFGDLSIGGASGEDQEGQDGEEEKPPEEEIPPGTTGPGDRGGGDGSRPTPDTGGGNGTVWRPL
jgi:hypothetical protein